MEWHEASNLAWTPDIRYVDGLWLQDRRQHERRHSASCLSLRHLRTPCHSVDQPALATGDTFVDLGANIGYFTLLASRLVGGHGRVVAIEASPSIFSQLQSNLTLNRVRNVRAVNVAIADHERTVKLYRGPTWNVGQTTVLETADYDVEGEVAAASLSVVLHPEELRSARLMGQDPRSTGAWCRQPCD